MLKMTLACCAACLIAAPALTQPAQPPHSTGHQGMGMQHGNMPQGQMMQHGQMMMQNTAANPYAEAELRMHHRMMGAQGKTHDETWVRKMIEHHQGGIEMSRILLEGSGDKEVKDKARKTMAEQQGEVAELQSWLKRHVHTPQ